MKNSDKYKTAKERAKAFQKWCFEQNCADGCPYKAKLNCVFAWLDLEAEEEKPLPCPCCHGSANLTVKIERNLYSVSCVCGYSSSLHDTKEKAIAAHNRVAKKCR